MIIVSIILTQKTRKYTIQQAYPPQKTTKQPKYAK